VNALQGTPVLLINFNNFNSYPTSLDPTTYYVRQSSMDANNTLFFNVDPEFRFNNDPYCAQAGYALAGGNTICTIYIAVECSGACVYEITLVQSRLDLNKTFSNKNVPIYLTNDAFYTGSVNYNQTKYFYYPVN